MESINNIYTQVVKGQLITQWMFLSARHRYCVLESLATDGMSPDALFRITEANPAKHR